jgi:RNA polymerase sigma factor (sigma-70 family)
MEVSALRYSGGFGLHGRSPLLRLQSDERLIALIRRGTGGAFEVLVSRYHTRLLAFCRHLLGSREDAEDVLQEVMAAAFNAILADERPINVRPWLYRIARNRSLNHLRRIQAIGVDSMDIHFSENGASTADKVHDRERFQLLVGDIRDLPETQRTALVLREMDALSYEQIAEAMDTTVPGVKSLLVRARISLAEASEARLLSCDDVRIELAEVAEGLSKRPTPLVRRHLRSCTRCGTFQTQLKQTNKALAALLPIGPLALLRQLAIIHLGHSAGTGSGATAAGATGATGGATAGATAAGAAGQAAAVAGTAGGGAVFGSASGLISAGAGAIASKAAAGLAAAALVTAGAVEASHTVHRPHHPTAAASMVPYAASTSATTHQVAPVSLRQGEAVAVERVVAEHHHARKKKAAHALLAKQQGAASQRTPKLATATSTAKATDKTDPKKRTEQPGRTQTLTDPTVLASSPQTTTPTPDTSSSPTTPSSSSNGWSSPTTTTTTSTSTGSGTTTASPSTDSGGSGATTTSASLDPSVSAPAPTVPTPAPTGSTSAPTGSPTDTTTTPVVASADPAGTAVVPATDPTAPTSTTPSTSTDPAAPIA